MRANVPTLEPNLLLPLPNSHAHMRKRTELQRTAKRLANRIIANGIEAPIHGYARTLRQPRWNSKRQVVQDDASRVALVICSRVHVRNVHCSLGER